MKPSCFHILTIVSNAMINMGGYTKDEVYVYNDILFSHEKGNAAVCNNLDEAWGHYAKWNKSDRERQILYDVTYMWNLKNNTNESILKMETDL